MADRLLRGVTWGGVRRNLQLKLEADVRHYAAAAGQAADVATVAPSKTAVPSKPKWWDAAELTFKDAMTAVGKSMRDNSTPPGNTALRELWQRVGSEADARHALRLQVEASRRRAAVEQHTNFSGAVAAAAVKSMTSAGAADAAAELLLRRAELGLAVRDSAPWHMAMSAKGFAGDLQGMLELWRAMPKGLTSCNTLAVLVRCSLTARRPDLAAAYVLEFEANGQTVRPSIRRLLQLYERGVFSQAGEGDAANQGDESSGEEVAAGADKAKPEGQQ